MRFGKKLHPNQAARHEEREAAGRAAAANAAAEVARLTIAKEKADKAQQIEIEVKLAEQQAATWRNNELQQAAEIYNAKKYELQTNLEKLTIASACQVPEFAENLKQPLQILQQEIESLKAEYHQHCEEIVAHHAKQLQEISHQRAQLLEAVAALNVYQRNVVEVRLAQELEVISNHLAVTVKDIKHKSRGMLINAVATVAGLAGAYFAPALFAGYSASIMAFAQRSLLATGLGSLANLMNGKDDTIGIKLNLVFMPTTNFNNSTTISAPPPDPNGTTAFEVKHAPRVVGEVLTYQGHGYQAIAKQQLNGNYSVWLRTQATQNISYFTLTGAQVAAIKRGDYKSANESYIGAGGRWLRESGAREVLDQVFNFACTETDKAVKSVAGIPERQLRELVQHLQLHVRSDSHYTNQAIEATKRIIAAKIGRDSNAITPLMARAVAKCGVTEDELLLVRTVVELAPFARLSKLATQNVANTIQRGLTVVDNAMVYRTGRPLLFRGMISENYAAALDVFAARIKPAGGWSLTAIVKALKLPQEGRIRFIPRSNHNITELFQKGKKGGYIDRFDNEWVKGPSRTIGEAFEWDVQLSATGQHQLGHQSRNGKYINVSLKGRITHR